MAIAKSSEDRLFFIIKTGIMGNMGGVLFLTIVFFKGTINFWETFVLGLFAFVFSLIVARYFESQINRISKWINHKINRRPMLRKFIEKYL